MHICSVDLIRLLFEYSIFIVTEDLFSFRFAEEELGMRLAPSFVNELGEDFDQSLALRFECLSLCFERCAILLQHLLSFDEVLDAAGVLLRLRSLGANDSVVV